jgi:hypothetical protein
VARASSGRIPCPTVPQSDADANDANAPWPIHLSPSMHVNRSGPYRSGGGTLCRTARRGYHGGASLHQLRTDGSRSDGFPCPDGTPLRIVHMPLLCPCGEAGVRTQRRACCSRSWPSCFQGALVRHNGRTCALSFLRLLPLALIGQGYGHGIATNRTCDCFWSLLAAAYRIARSDVLYDFRVIRSG